MHRASIARQVPAAPEKGRPSFQNCCGGVESRHACVRPIEVGGVGRAGNRRASPTSQPSDWPAATQRPPADTPVSAQRHCTHERHGGHPTSEDRMTYDPPAEGWNDVEGWDD